MSVIKQSKEPEVEETDAEVEAFVEKKIEETRAKIKVVEFSRKRSDFCVDQRRM